jgi:hypothetical protein
MLLKDMGKISYDFSGCSFTQKGSKEAEKTRNIYAIDTLKGVWALPHLVDSIKRLALS